MMLLGEFAVLSLRYLRSWLPGVHCAFCYRREREAEYLAPFGKHGKICSHCFKEGASIGCGAD